MPGRVLRAGLLAFLAASSAVSAAGTFEDRLRNITGRPEYQHSQIGIAVFSLDSDKVIYRLNASEYFVPGSVTKLMTTGTALSLLGPDYRFHTRVYRTAPLGQDGTLKGDVILVASGDPNLSNRLQEDGTLSFANVDHDYSFMSGSAPVKGDPLLVLRSIVKQIQAAGVRNIDGRVLVDDSLFQGRATPVGPATSSPIVVNDNLIDVTVQGTETEKLAQLIVSPLTAYARIVNRVTTSAAGTKSNIQVTGDTTTPDGNHVITISGSVPTGGSAFTALDVPDPRRFAEVLLKELLREAGVSVSGAGGSNRDQLQRSYVPENQVAEHVSPPLIEAVKVILKVSQNTHASMLPFIVGAAFPEPRKSSFQAGFDREHEFLGKAGLDLNSLSQADGAGGHTHVTPDFIVRFLAYMTRQPFFAGYQKALPILGVDGTLWDIQAKSPAAGKVFAKTGTYADYDALNRQTFLLGKGLAGYTTSRSGHHLALGIFINGVQGDENVAHRVGETLGEIATAIWQEL